MCTCLLANLLKEDRTQYGSEIGVTAFFSCGVVASWGRSSDVIVYLVWGLAPSHGWVASSKLDRNLSAQFSSTNSAFVALIAICLRSSLLQIRLFYVHHVNERPRCSCFVCIMTFPTLGCALLRSGTCGRDTRLAFSAFLGFWDDMTSFIWLGQCFLVE